MKAISDFIGDLQVLYAALTTKPPAPDEIKSFPLLVEENARRYPDETALLCEDEAVTWKGLNERANRMASYLKSEGINLGDCISLFMLNRIEFVVQVVAITKIGAIASLINTNLTRRQLTHCISIGESKKIIFGEELTGPLNEVRPELQLEDGRDYLFVRDTGTEPAPNWATELDSQNEIHANPTETSRLQISDTAFYLFTSGTTGLPKAARVSHRRMLLASGMAANLLLRIKQPDRMYNCLPLYHGTGLMVGLTSAFTVGASTLIRRKFSTSAFWDDIRKHDCTCFVYIGELLRYLMNPPETPDDRENPVRAIVGNGLRPDIWMDFKQRFDIDRIGEFYGASEGNGGFANVFNKDCTVGLATTPVKIIAYDVARDEIIRNEQGFCIEQPLDEAGLLVIEITDEAPFEGYTNEKASNSKILRNLFQPDDAYFNSGDLMKAIKPGFAFGQKHYQFIDRVGDTFRWKSENVSTNEVEAIINQHEDIAFANVYGVEIPGTDGRAGMAAIVPKPGLDAGDLNLKSISAHVTENLPGYARPVFVRVLKDLPTTSTHKLQKNELRDQAFHLDKVSDPLLVMRPGSTTYSTLDADCYDQIMNRSLSF